MRPSINELETTRRALDDTRQTLAHTQETLAYTQDSLVQFREEAKIVRVCLEDRVSLGDDFSTRNLMDIVDRWT
jgi:hypothetical protein